MSVNNVTVSSSQPISFLPQVLWALDYVPVVSTVKGITDIFLTHHWNPTDVDQLSWFARGYYEHLTDKDDFRYIAIIPVLGNLIVLIRDCNNAIITQYDDDQTENGSIDAIEKLYKGSPEQRARAISYCYQEALKPNPYESTNSAQKFLLNIVCESNTETAITMQEKALVKAWLIQNIGNFGSRICKRIYNDYPGLPSELREKIVDVFIDELQRSNGPFNSLEYEFQEIFKKESHEGKSRILTKLKEAVGRGNQQSFDFLSRVFVYHRSYQLDLNVQNETALFQWVCDLAENQTSLFNDLAWNLLKDQFYSNRQQVTAAYLRLLQAPTLPQQKLDVILNSLRYDFHFGTVEKKRQILSGFQTVANSGNIQIIFEVAQFYKREGNRINARDWFDKGARANHLPSILGLINILLDENNLQGAIYWAEKARPLCASASQSDRLNFSYFQSRIESMRLRERADSRANAAREEFERSQREFESQQRAQAERERSEQRAQEARREQGQARQNEERARQNADQQRARAAEERRRNAVNEFNTAKSELESLFGTASLGSAVALDRAFKVWSVRNHPDKQPNKTEATLRFQRVRQIIEIYKNYKKEIGEWS